MKKRYLIIRTLLIIFVNLPIWYYLMYKVLQYVQASDLMWFLYWVYVPVGLLISIIGGLFNTDD